MENHHFSWENSLQMAIFNSYFDITRGYPPSKDSDSAWTPDHPQLFGGQMRIVIQPPISRRTTVLRIAGDGQWMSWYQKCSRYYVYIYMIICMFICMCIYIWLYIYVHPPNSDQKINSYQGSPLLLKKPLRSAQIISQFASLYKFLWVNCECPRVFCLLPSGDQAWQ